MFKFKYKHYIPYVSTKWGQLSSLITLPRGPLSCPNLFLLITHDKENCWKKFGGHILEKNGGLGGIGKKSKNEKKSLVFTPWCSIPYQIAHPWCSFRKNFELSGKKRVFGPSFAGTALKFLMGIATVSESMHKEVGRVQAKISGTPSQWFRVTHHWSSLMLILLLSSHPWCSFWVIPDSLCKKWGYCTRLTDIDLKFLLGIATLPETMHKESWRIREKISGGS